MFRHLAAAALLLTLAPACASRGGVSSRAAGPAPMPTLQKRLGALVEALPGDSLEVAVAVRDLATGDSLLINAHTRMHAASTMKVPVMLELFRRAEAGQLSLDDSIPVRNHFRSIADGSSYSLSPGDDSDPELYAQIGQHLSIRELMERMITRSSNLATNLLIDLADPSRIKTTLEAIGASQMQVLRGVEDTPAFQRGMNNTTTAYGLMRTMEGVAAGRVVSARATAEMLRILEGQKLHRMIAEGLPTGVRVGSKSGWLDTIEHDAAIVYPPGRAPYVLVVLTRGFRDKAAAERIGRDVSRAVWEELTRP